MFLSVSLKAFNFIDGAIVGVPHLLTYLTSFHLKHLVIDQKGEGGFTLFPLLGLKVDFGRTFVNCTWLKK